MKTTEKIMNFEFNPTFLKKDKKEPSDKLFLGGLLGLTFVVVLIFIGLCSTLRKTPPTHNFNTITYNSPENSILGGEQSDKILNIKKQVAETFIPNYNNMNKEAMISRENLDLIVTKEDNMFKCEIKIPTLSVIDYAKNPESACSIAAQHLNSVQITQKDNYVTILIK
jgi:hypothetical protein